MSEPVPEGFRLVGWHRAEPIDIGPGGIPKFYDWFPADGWTAEPDPHEDGMCGCSPLSIPTEYPGVKLIEVYIREPEPEQKPS